MVLKRWIGRIKKEYRRFPVLDQSTFWYIGWIRRKIYYTSETTFVFSLSISSCHYHFSTLSFLKFKDQIVTKFNLMKFYLSNYTYSYSQSIRSITFQFSKRKRNEKQKSIKFNQSNKSLTITWTIFNFQIVLQPEWIFSRKISSSSITTSNDPLSIK